MSSRRIESFVVRVVVRDEEIVSTSEWMGRIQHIATGNERQFKQIGDLLAFIAAHLREGNDGSLMLAQPANDVP